MVHGNPTMGKRSNGNIKNPTNAGSYLGSVANAVSPVTNHFQPRMAEGIGEEWEFRPPPTIPLYLSEMWFTHGSLFQKTMEIFTYSNFSKP